MNKKILILIALLFLPSIVHAQANLKASELNALTTPDSADIIIIGDVSATESKKITYGNFVSGIGGTGLGANLSSSTYFITSNTGTISLSDDNLVTTGTITASHFVATSSDPTILTKLEVTGSMSLPVGQNCPALVNGQACIDTNIGGFPSTITYVGAENERFGVMAIKVSDLLSAADGYGPVYDAVEDLMVLAPIPVELISGTAGTAIYPKTPTTTDFYIGNTSAGTADHVLYFSGAVELNKQKGAVDIVMSGDNETNLLFLDGSTDRIGIGTNNPQSILEVTGTLSVSGTGISTIKLNTVASADPCSGRTNTIFLKTGGIPCYCDASGVDKKIADDSACF